MMKRLCQIFVTLLISYIILNMIVTHFSKGYTLSYSLYRRGIDINITEIKKRNTKNEVDHYDFIIHLGKNEFKYRSLNSFSKKKVITDVKYLKDDKYFCILPIFDGKKIETDIICKDKNGIYYNYSSIDEPSENMISFADSIKGYERRNYQDQTGSNIKKDLITVYTNNVMEDFSFAITNYKGIYLLKNGIIDVKLFNQDYYTRDLSTFVGYYYVTANYDENYDFKTFYLVDLRNNEQSKIVSKTAIANDSYIAGIVNKEVYIVDKSNQKQYKLNVKEKTIKEVGNEKKGMLYYHEGNWEQVPYTRMTLKNTYFDSFKEKQDGDYHLFLKSEGQISGYSYYYRQKNNIYEIYRAPSDDKKTPKTFLFETTTIDKIKTAGEYLFFQEKEQIKYYSDKTGIRTILMDSELNFNSNILYGAYQK